MAKSPSITLIEKDASSYAVTTSSTILAIVGYATKGPIDDVQLVTSRNEFLEKFGPPPSDSPYSSLAAYRAFNETNQVLFYRVADEGGDSISAVAAERIVDANIATGGDTARVRVLMDEKGSALNGSYFTVETRVNPVSGDSEYDIQFYYNATLKETFSDVSWISGDTNYFETVINKDPDNGGSDWFSVDVEFYDASGDTATAVISDGTYYIGQADGGDSVAFTTGDTWTSLPGDSVTYDYRAGIDGIPSAGGDTLFTDALATSAELANQEVWDYHILVTPDTSSEAVANAGVTLAEYREDFIYLVDPPDSKTYSQIATWHNGGGQGRSTALNSSYAATYWPWLKDYNSETGEYVWAPPSVFVAEKYLFVDRNYDPWFAPAGDLRGRITAFDSRYSPSLSERDSLYGDLNAVNSIVNFNIKGLLIYGQKTLLRTSSALNRVNVRRMLIYAKKLIKRAMDSMVFEPHNADSWARATNLINAILEPIRQGAGLSDYRVVIDETTNTASRIQQSIMYGIIQLVPTGTIEIIELDIQIQAAGTTITG